MKSKKTEKDYLRLKYPIRIVEDEKGGWFVEIPDLPGCMTVVEDFKDAYEAIDLVKEGWIEIALGDGQDIPLPSTEKKYSGRFVLRIAPSLHERLVEQAEAEEMSLNAYCLYLLSLGAGRREATRSELPAEDEDSRGPSLPLAPILEAMPRIEHLHQESVKEAAAA
jgi:antitoxin HicB